MNNIIYTLKRHLPLQDSHNNHFIIYNNEFVTKNIFDVENQVIQDDNMFLYAYHKKTLEHVKAKMQLNKNNAVYVICGKDCQIEKNWYSCNELGCLIRELKNEGKKQSSSLSVFQVVHSGVYVGYISELKQIYPKSKTKSQ
jgi:hypothetical protein